MISSAFSRNTKLQNISLWKWVLLGPVAKFRWSAWLDGPRAGLGGRRFESTPERQCVTCVTKFWILIISIHTSRLGNRIKQIWQPLLFIKGYLCMEYTLFQLFARKIPCPEPLTSRPGRAQSGRTPEFGYGPLQYWFLADWSKIRMKVSFIKPIRDFVWSI